MLLTALYYLHIKKNKGSCFNRGIVKVGKSNHSPCKLTLKAFKLLASDLKRFKPKTRSAYIFSGKNYRTTFTYQNFHQLYIYMHKAYLQGLWFDLPTLLTKERFQFTKFCICMENSILFYISMKICVQ
jgi:hypothetical protein